MLPLNIWDARDILGTAVFQSITQAVVNKVVCSLLSPLGMISPGGLQVSSQCHVVACVHRHFFAPRHTMFSGSVQSPAFILPLFRLQKCLSAQTGPSIIKAAQDYKARICLAASCQTRRVDLCQAQWVF